MTNPTERANRSKRQSRGWSDDMDSHAISSRLAIVEELYATWLALKNARKTPSPSGREAGTPIWGVIRAPIDDGNEQAS